MLELFLTALEDQLGLLVNPPLAPIARMNVISLEITRLTRFAEQRDAPVQPEQKCPWCEGEGIVANIIQGEHTCAWCNGTGISKRSGGG